MASGSWAPTSGCSGEKEGAVDDVVDHSGIDNHHGVERRSVESSYWARVDEMTRIDDEDPAAVVGEEDAGGGGVPLRLRSGSARDVDDDGAGRGHVEGEWGRRSPRWCTPATIAAVGPRWRRRSV